MIGVGGRVHPAYCPGFHKIPTRARYELILSGEEARTGLTPAAARISAAAGAGANPTPKPKRTREAASEADAAGGPEGDRSTRRRIAPPGYAAGGAVGAPGVSVGMLDLIADNVTIRNDTEEAVTLKGWTIK